MAAGMNNNKKTFFRKPLQETWITTVVVILYMVGCVVLIILTERGLLLNSQSFECRNSEKDTTRLQQESSLVYMSAGISLPICVLLLVKLWITRTPLSCLLVIMACVLFGVMAAFFTKTWVNETQEIEEFEERYLALIPLIHTPRNTQTCHGLNNVYRWQAEFKCCGLKGYKDWLSTIPDSCFCEAGQNNSSGCVEVGNSLVYEKPCLPAVLSLLGKRSSTFWIVMIVWIIIAGLPVAILLLGILFIIFICCKECIVDDGCYELSVWRYKRNGGEDMVPVVFIRKDNNKQTEEENLEGVETKESGKEESVVLDVADGTSAKEEEQKAEEGHCDDYLMRRIPVSQLKRLQEELDPPPVQHQAQCLCIGTRKTRNFYIIWIEEGSPLLPSNAVLADANKPPLGCGWAEGPHVFAVEDIVWPNWREYHKNVIITLEPGQTGALG
ncbi:uncharacterized protein LOC108890155 [Lates calcarifer]|uniref:Uncharacterized protein LOC108890155 n=1 Tax=Lates calcarifer TaxID=8187 RepID=A0AAJ7PZ74_LATCA|nr:uncharacterized protein LOC108890155 [Lates calcarifer]